MPVQFIFYMISYRYSVYQDLKWMLRTYRNTEDLHQKGLKIFPVSFYKMVLLWFKRPKNVFIESSIDIVCFWISSGTWGAYTPPEKIFICPWKINGGMLSDKELRYVINHEITHLRFYLETKDLSFKDRENFINNIQIEK